MLVNNRIIKGLKPTYTNSLRSIQIRSFNNISKKTIFNFKSINGEVMNTNSTKTIKHYSTIREFDFNAPKSIINANKQEEIKDIKLNLNLKVSEIETLTNEIIGYSQSVLDSISILQPSECTFESVIMKLAKLEGWKTVYSSCCTFPMYVATSKEIRTAATQAYSKLAEFDIKASMREDIYIAVCHAKENLEDSKEMNKLDEEDKRFIKKLMEEYHKLGFHLDKEKRKELADVLVELSNICNTFSNNVAADNTTITLNKKELAGLSESYFNSIKKLDNDNFEITMQYPDITPILEKASNPETRKKVEFVNTSRCKENISLLERALVLREKVANILNFDCYPEYKLIGRMANNSKQIISFLEGIKEGFQPLLEKEKEQLLKLKKKEEFNATQLYSYDIAYYKDKLIQQECKVDQQIVQGYFPLEHVNKTMFEIFETTFDIKFEKVANNNQWHSQVDLFKVSDKNNSTLGFFYMDLFPREGKFTHAACFPLQPSESNSRPVVAMVCNFTKPNSENVSLLRHYEVVTLFHELGHTLHCLLSKPKHARFSGVNVELDFVETPSQLLEFWCWDKECLKKLTKHYKTGKQMDDELINNLIKSKRIGQALFFSRQIIFALYDIKLHSIKNASNINSVELMNQIRKEVMNIEQQPNTFPNATFNHIMGGYDVGYYSYLWALVYASDIYFEKFSNNNLNTLVGKQYKELILQKGGSDDAINMLTKFLGREPNKEHFIQKHL